MSRIRPDAFKVTPSRAPLLQRQARQARASRARPPAIQTGTAARSFTGHALRTRGKGCSRSMARAWPVFADGAQGPGLGQHHPLVTSGTPLRKWPFPSAAIPLYGRGISPITNKAQRRSGASHHIATPAPQRPPQPRPRRLRRPHRHHEADRPLRAALRARIAAAFTAACTRRTSRPAFASLLFTFVPAGRFCASWYHRHRC